MDTFTETLGNGNKIKYKRTAEGTCYHAETCLTLIDVLEMVRLNETRIRIWLGDTKTGRSWNEENDIIGRIGRSTGWRKIPLLVHNTRSMGGGALLDHCIVKVVNVQTSGTLYQHDKFHQALFTVRGNRVFL